jgi:predicted nucleic acid-binding protein
MTRHLLDTDAVIDFYKGFPSTVELIRRLYRQGETLRVCDVVVAEVYAGLAPAERARGQELLGALSFLPTSLDIARQAGI